MSGILVVAESRRGELRDVSMELIGAALGLKEQAGGRVAVAIIGADVSQHTDALAVAGVDEVLTVQAPGENFEAHAHGEALVALIEQESPTLVLLGHTIDSLGFGPAVAAKLGLGFSSDVTALDWEDGPIATRDGYAEKVQVELDFPGKETVLLMLRVGAFEPAAEGSGDAPVRAVEAAGEARTEHLGFREVESGDVDITKAEFLLSIGRGIEDKDALPQFEELADRIGATLSVSRPLVDAGWVSNARQVGQSGKTVKPKVYLALGISGAVQHLAGMQNADTIIAVNTDPEAPIFRVADYGAVADLFDVADELAEQFED
jgi:electron transfer flavoprotein alpha subunit